MKKRKTNKSQQNNLSINKRKGPTINVRPYLIYLTKKYTKISPRISRTDTIPIKM